MPRCATSMQSMSVQISITARSTQAGNHERDPLVRGRRAQNAAEHSASTKLLLVGGCDGAVLHDCWVQSPHIVVVGDCRFCRNGLDWDSRAKNRRRSGARRNL